MSEPSDEEAAERRRQQKIQRQLDEALAASSPASDPVSIVTSGDEEDWGTDPAAPAPPESKAPPHGASLPPCLRRSVRAYCRLLGRW
jgi:hypothetical protein